MRKTTFFGNTENYEYFDEYCKECGKHLKSPAQAKFSPLNAAYYCNQCEIKLTQHNLIERLDKAEEMMKQLREEAFKTVNDHCDRIINTLEQKNKDNKETKEKPTRHRQIIIPEDEEGDSDG